MDSLVTTDPDCTWRTSCCEKWWGVGVGERRRGNSIELLSKSLVELPQLVRDIALASVDVSWTNKVILNSWYSSSLLYPLLYYIFSGSLSLSHSLSLQSFLFILPPSDIDRLASSYTTLITCDNDTAVSSTTRGPWWNEIGSCPFSRAVVHRLSFNRRLDFFSWEPKTLGMSFGYE